MSLSMPSDEGLSYEGATSSNAGAKFLFACVGLFYWITLTPFVDLTVDPATAKPPPWSQLVVAGLFIALMTYAMRATIRPLIVRPRGLMLLIFGWFLLSAAASPGMIDAIRRVMIAITVTISASVFLMLPASERQFAKLIAAGVTITVGLCYFGILFLPHLSIHQGTDFLEPQHAGLWRGIYLQKNETGVVMAMSCFIGLYIASSWSRLAGFALVAISAFFLSRTGAKTSMAMMPAMIVLSYVFERWRWTRGLIVFGGIGMMNLLTVGVTGIKPVREFVQSLGIDATYTARSDIWELALNAIAARPLTGYGIGGFWQTDSLKHSGLAAYTWAVAAVDAHNGYVDAAINAGLPGLALMIIWVLWLPQRNIQAAENANNFTPLTRLFLRIWLYGIFLACLESVFMARSGPIWFTICVAMFGLGFQARCSVVNDRGNVPSNGRTYARVSSIRADQRG